MLMISKSGIFSPRAASEAFVIFIVAVIFSPPKTGDLLEVRSDRL